jgi:DNA-binding transcriptional regulator LsrR (DeoR family)
MFKDMHKMALSSDLAIVSIGGLDSATIRAVDMVNDEKFHSVKDAGAIGNFLGYYIDTTGNIVDHPINQRIIGVSGDEFRKIPHRMMISGGDNKVAALLAVLAQRLVSDLVTDSQTAKALLEAG